MLPVYKHGCLFVEHSKRKVFLEVDFSRGSLAIYSLSQLISLHILFGQALYYQPLIKNIQFLRR